MLATLVDEAIPKRQDLKTGSILVSLTLEMVFFWLAIPSYD